MFLKRLLIVGVISLSGAYLMGIIFDSLYKKRWSAFFFDKTEELVNGKINYDIIFLGNSKMHFGINPYYFDSVTTYNSYNFGYGSSDAEDMLLTTSVYLANKKTPKLAIISLDMMHLMKHKNFITNYYNLFYLYNDSIEIKLNRAGYPTHLIQLFPFIKYSYFDEYNRTSIFVNKSIPKFNHNIYNGFINIHQPLNVIQVYKPTNEIDTLKVSGEAIDNLNKIVINLQHAGTTVVFIEAPEKSTASERSSPYKKLSDSIIQNLVTKYNLKFMSFENLFNNDAYFSDQFHLNEPGTRIYSRSLGDSINKYFPHP